VGLPAEKTRGLIIAVWGEETTRRRGAERDGWAGQKVIFSQILGIWAGELGLIGFVLPGVGGGSFSISVFGAKV